jgi:glycosyltransferase involved in cell wall biosynthesis
LGGSAEIMSAGAGTLKFWPGEADDMAGAISKLVGDPALRKNLGESARKTVVQHFGRERLAEDLENLWKRLSVGSRALVIEPTLPLEENALAAGI